MMYKALLVDDDPIIRKGLSMMVDWEDLGFHLTGMARDGEEAIEKILEERPDLVISDIKMPGINGLEMMQSIRDDFPDMQIVIITGYRNFDYAREALKLGALEILLKPTRLEELKAVIFQAAENLKKLEQLQSVSKSASRTREEFHLWERQESLSRLTMGTPVGQEILERLEKELELTGKQFKVLLLDSSQHKSRNTSVHHSSMEKILRSSLSIGQLILIQQKRFQSSYLWIFPYFRENGAMEHLRQEISTIAEIIRTNLGVEISLSVSTSGRRLSVLPELNKEAEELQELSFIFGLGKLLEQPADLSSFCDEDKLEEQKKLWILSIREGNPRQLKDFFQNKEPFWSFQWEERELKRIFVQILREILKIRDQYDLTDPEEEAEWDPVTLIEQVMHAATVSSIMLQLIPFSVSTAEQIAEKLKQDSINYVSRAKSFIQNNFTREITLQETADVACVSIFYLSRLFTKNEGISFSSFLNKIRIEEAKKLLASTRLKSYEVAERIGLPDPYYFSKVFKKIEGITPSEFRKSQELT